MVSRISSPRFIGRAEELEALGRVLARAESGSGGAVLVAGEAGIGKSRLVTELEERARRADAMVLVGDCVELVGERLSLHRAIAETLSAHPEYAVAGVAAELAYHWHEAGDEQAALSASVEAAAMHAHGEALGHIERALEVWDRVEGQEAQLRFDRVELLLRRALLHERHARYDTSRAHAPAPGGREGHGRRPPPAPAASTRGCGCG